MLGGNLYLHYRLINLPTRVRNTPEHLKEIEHAVSLLPLSELRPLWRKERGAEVIKLGRSRAISLFFCFRLRCGSDILSFKLFCVWPGDPFISIFSHGIVDKNEREMRFLRWSSGAKNAFWMHVQWDRRLETTYSFGPWPKNLTRDLSQLGECRSVVV